MKDYAKSLLLDTNIWLDNYLGNRPSSESSRKLISFAQAHQIALFYSVTSLRDTCFNVALELKRGARIDGQVISESEIASFNETALACAKNMYHMATAVGVDGSDAWLALKLLPIHHDLEDNLILAAMERSNASFLVTNDAQLIKHANCAAMTSEDMLDYLKTFAE